MFNVAIVTAVSRPENLPRLLRSILSAERPAQLAVSWYLIPTPDVPRERIREVSSLSAGIAVRVEDYTGTPRTNGINQKNLALDLLTDEMYYHCLDDDNILHPNFFSGISRALTRYPDKQAFAFHQQRWDSFGLLKAHPSSIQPLHVDNAMFVVAKALIGTQRYTVALAGVEDGHFYQELFRRDPSSFAFVDEILCYYNYLRHFPES